MGNLTGLIGLYYWGMGNPYDVRRNQGLKAKRRRRLALLKYVALGVLAIVTVTFVVMAVTRPL